MAYTPAKTRNYEALVRAAFLDAFPGFQPYALGTPLVLTVVAKFQLPKSASKKKRAAMLRGEIRPTRKPDCDNILKLVADALQPIAFQDDSCIVRMVCRKIYSTEPGLVVELNELAGSNNKQDSGIHTMT